MAYTLTSADLARFEALFSGSTKGYTVFTSQATKEGEKQKGQVTFHKKTLTSRHFLDHLEGKESLGIVPIFGDRCRFAVLDVDVYPSSPMPYMDIAHKYDLPIAFFKSKSGGLHIYTFFEQEVLAVKAIELMQEVRLCLGLPSTCEIFPKQNQIYKGFGNAINIPYFNFGRHGRWMYSPQGERMRFTDMLDECWRIRTSPLRLKKKIESTSLYGAPPCLQSLYLKKQVNSGNRNIFLFNLGVYARKKYGEGYKDFVKSINSSLPSPLTGLELERTILTSLTKSATYFYQCNDSILSAYCDKKLCIQAKHGKGQAVVLSGQGEEGTLTFGPLVQVQSDPPFYKWTISGKELPFFSEAALRKQDTFLDLCIRHLHILPKKMKTQEWEDHIALALSTMRIEEAPQSISSVDLWKKYLDEYLSTRSIANSLTQVSMGLVYIDEQGIWFKPEHFIFWLQKFKNYKDLSLTEQYYHMQTLHIETGKKLDPVSGTTFACAVCPHESVSLLRGEAIEKLSEEKVIDIKPLGPTDKDAWQKRLDTIQTLLDDLDDVPVEDFTPQKEK